MSRDLHQSNILFSLYKQNNFICVGLESRKQADQVGHKSVCAGRLSDWVHKAY